MISKSRFIRKIRNYKKHSLFAHIPLIIRSFFKRELVSDMNSKSQCALCQQLCAENKDLVLSHSSKTYQEIRQYLK